MNKTDTKQEDYRERATRMHRELVREGAYEEASYLLRQMMGGSHCIHISVHNDQAWRTGTGITQYG